MSGVLWRALVIAGLVTLAAGALLAGVPAHRGDVARGWALAVGLVAALTAARLLTPVPEGARRRRPPPLAEPEVPRDLQQARIAVELGRGSEFELHHRLRPLLAEVAESLLAARAGIDMQAEPERAAVALGPDLWQLVRPDRPEPPGRGRQSPAGEAVESWIARLEALAR